MSKPASRDLAASTLLPASSTNPEAENARTRMAGKSKAAPSTRRNTSAALARRTPPSHQLRAQGRRVLHQHVLWSGRPCAPDPNGNTTSQEYDATRTKRKTETSNCTLGPFRLATPHVRCVRHSGIESPLRHVCRFLTPLAPWFHTSPAAHLPWRPARTPTSECTETTSLQHPKARNPRHCRRKARRRAATIDAELKRI